MTIPIGSRRSVGALQSARALRGTSLRAALPRAARSSTVRWSTCFGAVEWRRLPILNEAEVLDANGESIGGIIVFTKDGYPLSTGYLRLG